MHRDRSDKFKNYGRWDPTEIQIWLKFNNQSGKTLTPLNFVQGGIHLKSDPVPVKGKDFNGSWTKPLCISEGFCYFFLLLLLLFVILKVLRSNGLYHPHASVLNTTMQCWHWLYWMSVCYSEVCMLLNKWDWRKKRHLLWFFNVRIISVLQECP